MNTKKLKKIITKRNLIIAGLAAVIAVSGWFGFKKFHKPAPKEMYEAAVVVRSQQNPNKSEDARTSLKAGDVLVIQKGTHSWSSTEKISYLILDMNLTADQAAKLTRAKTRELKDDELTDDQKKMMADEKKRAKDEGRDYAPEPQTETVLAREYYIDLEKVGFTDPGVLYNGQPFAGQVFDWGIVRKK